MGAISDLFLHTPWWIALLIVLAGLGLLMSGNRRQDKTLLRVGFAVVLAGIVLGAIGFMFPSDRQKMEKRTRQMVEAVNTENWDGLGALLDERTAVGSESRTAAVGREALVNAVKEAREKWGVKSVTASGIESKQTDTLITVTFNAYCDTAQYGPALSSWQIDYQQQGDVWIMEKITCVRVGGISPDQVFNGLR